MKLAEYVDGVHGNSRTYLEGHQDVADLLQAIENSFAEVLSVGALHHHGPILFVAMAHASYLAAVQLATSGQLPPAYMASRGVLEAALYGWYVMRRPKLKGVWSSRHVDAAAKKLVRNSFKMVDMRAALQAEEPRIENQFGVAYETTIDLGAHPNSLALWTNLSEPDTEGFRTYNYVNTEELARRQSVYAAAFSALTALFVILLAFRSELASSDLPERVIELQNALVARFPDGNDAADEPEA